MKKFSFLLFLGLATACYAADSPIAGFYAGVSTGYCFGKALSYGQLSHYAPKGTFGGVFMGGGFTAFSKLYLGTEVSYARCAMKQYWRRTPLANLRKFRIKDHLEVATRIGYEGKTMLPYVKLGYAWNTVTVTNQISGYKFFDGTLSGFTWGLGLDIKLSQRISAGFGYTCAEFKKKKRGGFKKLTNQSVFMRLAYHF
ncbi:MAG: outer membrane protein [Alphaproteobacteria bacterium]